MSTLSSRDPSKLNHIRKAFFLTALFSCWVHGASGQLTITPDVPVARVGQTVTLYINQTLSAFRAAWYKGLSVTVSNRILTYSFSTNVTETGPWYNGKEAALPDGSLRLTDVWRNHTGSYTVRITSTDGLDKDAIAEIGVYDVLTPPTLVNTSGSGFTMECQAGGQTVDRYAFFKDTMSVTCDQQRINCSEHSPVLSFHPLKESDSGSYTCTITNPVSQNTSLPLEIRVKVAPISNVTISSNQTSGRLWENLGSVQLSCAAQGTEPVFFWMRGGRALPQDPRYHFSEDNSSLTISPVTREDHGTYHCNASNSANTESSDPLPLDISWRPRNLIQCAAVKYSNEISLRCSWAGGNPPATVNLIYPKAHGMVNNDVSVSISQSSLMRGTEMTCIGSQEGQTQRCALLFDFPYDPNYQEGNITSAIEGEHVSLEVNLKQSSGAYSGDILPATFRWFINSSLSFAPDEIVHITANQTFTMLRISRVSEKSTGDYRCEAVNLMGTTNFSFAVITTKAQVVLPVSTELSGGAIAGIVIGIVVLLVLTGVGAFFVGRRSRDPKRTQNKRSGPAISQPVEPVYEIPKKTSVEPPYANLKNPSGESQYANLKNPSVLPTMRR